MISPRRLSVAQGTIAKGGNVLKSDGEIRKGLFQLGSSGKKAMKFA